MGWPDWSKQVRPGKSMFLEGQIPWGQWFVGTLPRWSATKVLDTTVPAGYDWHLTLMFIFCDWTGRQRVTLVITPGLDSDYWFNGHFALPLHPESGMLIRAGTSIEVYVFNNDTLPRQFTGVLVGILEKV